MNYVFILFISLGASTGALLRWRLGVMLNPLFPTLPLGTLAANLIGGFIIGIFMEVTRNHGPLPEAARLGIITGFLGGLTTFSTFSAEAVALIALNQYLWVLTIIVAHVGGSIIATILGIYTTKLILA